MLTAAATSFEGTMGGDSVLAWKDHFVCFHFRSCQSWRQRSLPPATRIALRHRDRVPGTCQLLARLSRNALARSLGQETEKYKDTVYVSGKGRGRRAAGIREEGQDTDREITVSMHSYSRCGSRLA